MPKICIKIIKIWIRSNTGPELIVIKVGLGVHRGLIIPFVFYMYLKFPIIKVKKKKTQNYVLALLIQNFIHSTLSISWILSNPLPPLLRIDERGSGRKDLGEKQKSNSLVNHFLHSLFLLILFNGIP